MADELTTQVAGALIRVTPRRIQQLISEGWIKRPLTVASVVHGYLDFRDDADRRAAKSAAASRVQDARAREIELRAARDEQELVPIEEAIAYAQAVVGALISRMNGLPARITRNIDERRKIEAVLDDVRDEVAKAISEHGPSYRGVPDAGPAGAKGIAKRVGERQPRIPRNGRHSRSKKPVADSIRSPDH